MARKVKSKAAKSEKSSPQVGEVSSIIVAGMEFPGPAPFVGELPSQPVVAEVSATPVVQETSAPTPTSEPEFVDVIARRYQWEPFQKIAIMPGVATPVRLTSWVKCQLEAKVLRRG